MADVGGGGAWQEMKGRLRRIKLIASLNAHVLSQSRSIGMRFWLAAFNSERSLLHPFIGRIQPITLLVFFFSVIKKRVRKANLTTTQTLQMLSQRAEEIITCREQWYKVQRRHASEGT